MTESIWRQLSKVNGLLRRGSAVALPTETVYGLAARVDQPEAIERIFSIKQRPSFDPLIVHVSGPKMARQYVVDWPEAATRLSEAFWPGPLTIVLPKSDRVDDRITAGLSSVALRAPRHPYFLRILRQQNCGLAAPSANRFSKTSPSRAEHVRKEFQSEVFVLDGGNCEVGIESTVLSIEEGRVRIHRPGMIGEDLIRSVLGKTCQIIFSESAHSPGQSGAHYQPEIELRLITHLDEETKKSGAALELHSEPSLAARELYHQLRECSQKGKSFIYFVVTKEQETAAWRPIMDRLRRAALSPHP